MSQSRRFSDVQVGQARGVLRSTHVTVRHVSTTDRVYRAMSSAVILHIVFNFVIS